ANALCRHGFRRRCEGRPFRVDYRLRRRGTWRAVEGVTDGSCRRKPRTTPAVPGGGVAGASLNAELATLPCLLTDPLRAAGATRFIPCLRPLFRDSAGKRYAVTPQGMRFRK